MKKQIKLLLVAISIILAFFLYKNITTEKHIVKNKRIPILMYHNVDEKYEENKIRIRPRKFEKDLIDIDRMGYTPISFDELIAYKKGKANLPEKPVIITFDDGYENVYKYAYPILRKHNMKAAMFIVAGRTGLQDFEGDKSRDYLKWDKLRDMEKEGLIKWYPHSFDLHYPKSNLEHGRGVGKAINESQEDYRLRLKEDFKKATDSIERELKHKSNVFAYPYGEYNQESEEILKEMGYEVTLTTKNNFGDIEKNLYVLKRFNMGAEKNIEDVLK